MNEERFEKAKEIKRSIAHIDGVLVFLKEIQNSAIERQKNDIVIHMSHAVFAPEPKSETIFVEDLTFVISAYEKEKQRLSQEFARL